MTPKPRKEDFRELKSKKFPGRACPRTPLEACAIGARFGKSVISYRRSAPAAPVLASHAGDLRGVRISSLPTEGETKYELP